MTSTQDFRKQQSSTNNKVTAETGAKSHGSATNGGLKSHGGPQHPKNVVREPQREPAALVIQQ